MGVKVKPEDIERLIERATREGKKGNSTIDVLVRVVAFLWEGHTTPPPDYFDPNSPDTFKPVRTQTPPAQPAAGDEGEVNLLKELDDAKQAFVANQDFPNAMLLRNAIDAIKKKRLPAPPTPDETEKDRAIDNLVDRYNESAFARAAAQAKVEEWEGRWAELRRDCLLASTFYSPINGDALSSDYVDGNRDGWKGAMERMDQLAAPVPAAELRERCEKGDDATPITPEWLQSIGGVHCTPRGLSYHDFELDRFDAAEPPNKNWRTVLRVHSDTDMPDLFSLGENENWNRCGIGLTRVSITTRGQLRRLLAALTPPAATEGEGGAE